MSFFKQFPRTKYDIRNDSNLISITNIFRNVDVNENMLDGFLNYKLERIEDGERPDQMSFRLYENTNFYWTFFIANDFLKDGYNSWPKGRQGLAEFIADEYGPYSVLVLDGPSIKQVCSITNPLNQTVTLDTTSGIKIHKIDETRQQIWLEGNYTILNNVESEAFSITTDDSPDSLSLTALDGFANAENAPYSYNTYNAETGAIIRTTDFTSYLKYHEDEDNTHSLIKVIRPGLITAFIDRYKELINE